MTDQEILQAMQTILNPINEKLSTIDKDIKSIKITLENETNRNIKIIAEGHSILNRRLDEALKVDSEKELLLIRVNVLENEVRKLKEKIESIA
ncbi:hypothetical protein [Enterocloster asparagiformis]|uniref:hypothetical protein n=1 Tax=Enterocloster asparagiformis TaxID=333367 RepID=UPI002A7F91DA|nr:hypothetical protein [Enterocloster asparagiformis]